MILRSSREPSWFFDVAEIAMFDPPAKTGATPPSRPGSTNVPFFSSFQTLTGSPAALVSASPIDQCAQPGAMIVAASGAPVVSLSLMLTHGVESNSPTGACDDVV